MNYDKIYNSIISAAKSRHITEYTENHHIVPKCIGGSNSKFNLVRLTYREHFICHWILCKIHKDNHKLKSAFAKMLECTKFKTRIITSRQFEIVKRHLSGTHFEWLKKYIDENGPWNKGLKGVQIAWNKGLTIGPHSIESNKQRSITAKKHWEKNIHHRSGKDPWNKGLIGVQEPWNKGKSLNETWICEHCNKSGNGHGNYKRWHGDNCKLKQH